MNTRTRRIAALGMLAALAYVVMAVGRIPLVPAAPFLKYDPKDVIIVIGGLIWGPISAFTISVVVSFVEMVTVSESGIIGFLMNVIATCSFACTASFIYSKRRTMAGAIIGLLSGVFLTIALMTLWNIIITPIYMGIPRAAVIDLLLPAIIPFNLIKSGLNAGLTMLLYKPIVLGLRKTKFLPESEEGKKKKYSPGIIILGIFLVATSILVILSFKGIF